MQEDDRRDYQEWSDADLAAELGMVDSLIEDYQTKIASSRRSMNRFMTQRENLLDTIRQRAQKKGWAK